MSGELRVLVGDVEKNQVVCVSGSSAELGAWQSHALIEMKQSQSNPLEWRLNISHTDDESLFYRYVVCRVKHEVDQRLLFIDRWESAVKPRTILKGSPTTEADRFGLIGEDFNVSAGWLTTETQIYILAQSSSLHVWGSQHTSVKLLVQTFYTDLKAVCEPGDTEVATLTPEGATFTAQPANGHVLSASGVTAYRVRTSRPTHLGFRIRVWSDDEALGYSSLLASALDQAYGTVTDLPIHDSTGLPVGKITLSYLVARPLCGVANDLSMTYLSHWTAPRAGESIGHRGLGCSHGMKRVTNVRENTLASFREAAKLSGVNGIETDVQLTKDFVPVIYHDFVTCLVASKECREKSEYITVPVKDLTLEEVRTLHVSHHEDLNIEDVNFSRDVEHRPFPTLEEILTHLPEDISIDLEIKYPQPLEDDTHEQSHFPDRQQYIDRILTVLLQHAGKRFVYISSFDPHVCVLARLKQSRFPVMLLELGPGTRYTRYEEPVLRDLNSVIAVARAHDLAGVVLHSEHVLLHPEAVSQVHSSGLLALTWGSDLNSDEIVKQFKNLNVDAVIHDLGAFLEDSHPLKSKPLTNFPVELIMPPRYEEISSL